MDFAAEIRRIAKLASLPDVDNPYSIWYVAPESRPTSLMGNKNAAWVLHALGRDAQLVRITNG